MIYILLCATALFVHSHGIHEYMTADEIMQVFQTTPDNLPEYEVVPVKHTINKRADNNYIVETTFKNSKLTLNLKPTESILVGANTKVWIAKQNPDSEHGIEYNLIENASAHDIFVLPFSTLLSQRYYAMARIAFNDIGTFYEDPENSGTVAITEDMDHENEMSELDGTLLFDGVIMMPGNNLVIRSLPKRHRRKREIQRFDSSSSEGDNTFTNTFDHVVFKIQEPPYLKRMSRSANSLDKISGASEINIKTKRSIPEVVYPEIMLVLDEKIYSNFEGSVPKALSYIITFWHGVDLRYRTLSEPKVRLNIAGIILSEDKLPYLNSYIEDANGQYIDSGPVLNDIGRYLYKEERFSFKKDYDLAAYMTGYDMVTVVQGGIDISVAGIAQGGSACVLDSWGKEVRAVSMFEDDCGFIGIFNAAHELAHIFGVVGHDESHCGDGYMMSAEHGPGMKNRFHFSKCSQEAMRDFFKTKSAECLFNTPPEDKPVSVILPGQYMSLDEQCRKRGMTKADNSDETVCSLLCCSTITPAPFGGLMRSQGCHAAAAEGSPCGEDLHCLDGQCVSKSSEFGY